MITINGVLTVKQISGANGKFCTGDLNTSIGEFKVKESILDQFEEGRYEGEFVIERFYLTSYVWRGKSTTDIRAKVTDIRLDTAEEGEVDNTMTEPDPVTEFDAPQTSAEGAVAVSVLADAVRSVDFSQSSNDANENWKMVQVASLLPIFGQELTDLILEFKSIKLDPAVDRALFRQQRDILKDRGYQFDAMTQAWAKKDGE